MAELVGDSLICLTGDEAKLLGQMLRERAKEGPDYMVPALTIMANLLQRPQTRERFDHNMFTVSVEPDRTPQ